MRLPASLQGRNGAVAGAGQHARLRQRLGEEGVEVGALADAHTRRARPVPLPARRSARRRGRRPLFWSERCAATTRPAFAPRSAAHALHQRSSSGALVVAVRRVGNRAHRVAITSDDARRVMVTMRSVVSKMLARTMTTTLAAVQTLMPPMVPMNDDGAVNPTMSLGASLRDRAFRCNPSRLRALSALRLPGGPLRSPPRAGTTRLWHGLTTLWR